MNVLVAEGCYMFFIVLCLFQCQHLPTSLYSCAPHVHNMCNKFLGWRVRLDVISSLCMLFGSSNSLNPNLPETFAYLFSCFPKSLTHTYNLRVNLNGFPAALSYFCFLRSNYFSTLLSLSFLLSYC